MDVFLFTIYVMMWPVGAFGALVMIVVAFIRDLLQARREGVSTKELV
jgi:hypothetical protein